MGLFYTLFIGIPASIFLMAIGLFFCATIIGIPVGMTCFAMGVKVLTLKPKPKVVVQR